MRIKQIFKRKEALESKLFKMKYAKLLKTLADQSYHKINQAQKSKVSSIYIENPRDPKVGIPANTYMFENVIKDAFNLDDSSSEEEEKA